MSGTTTSTAAGTQPTPADVPEVSPEPIMQVGIGFWASKTLLSAVEMELFTHLADHPQDLETLRARLGLHPRSARDFLDALVALGFLHRTDGVYRNTGVTDAFLDKHKPSYIGGILEMANARLYRFWGDLTEALRTGEPQNESKHGRAGLFEELYSKPERLEQFLRAMHGSSLGHFGALAETFDFSPYATVCDVGGATGLLSTILATRYPHLRCTTFD